MGRMSSKKASKKRPKAKRTIDRPLPVMGLGYCDYSFYARRNIMLRKVRKVMGANGKPILQVTIHDRVFDTEGIKAIAIPDGSKNVGSNGLDKKLRQKGLSSVLDVTPSKLDSLR